MAQTDSIISFVELKRLAESLLPRTSILRVLILSEPDYLPRQEGLVKLTVFVKRPYQEEKRQKPRNNCQ
jgi:hypothetical protein